MGIYIFPIYYVRVVYYVSAVSVVSARGDLLLYNYIDSVKCLPSISSFHDTHRYANMAAGRRSIHRYAHLPRSSRAKTRDSSIYGLYDACERDAEADPKQGSVGQTWEEYRDIRRQPQMTLRSQREDAVMGKRQSKSDRAIVGKKFWLI